MSESDYPPNGLSESVKKLPEWIQKGCGNEEYNCEEKGATFLGGNMPEELPDLSNHSSFFADAIRANPGVYKKLKDKKTKLGVTLGHCIKTGIDNPGKLTVNRLRVKLNIYSRSSYDQNRRYGCR